MEGLIMRKVFLDDLPRKDGIGKFKDIKVIDWKLCVGLNVNFVYDEYQGYFTIHNYYKINNNCYITFEYNNNMFKMDIKTFKKAYFKSVIHNEFLYNTMENCKDMFILDRFKNEYNTKIYKIKCNVCNEIYDVTESELETLKLCRYCYKKRRPKIEESIAITDPWMIPYFQGGYDEAKLYKYNSSKEIYPTCPDCGKVKNNSTPIYSIHNYHSIGCGCSDGKSYPNKFIECFIMQLNINYEIEKSFKWSDRKIYDDYIEDMSCIIENHGSGHYERCFEKVFNGSRTLEEEHENDKYKKLLAKQNGIKHYIVLDCRKSKLEWIKKSVMKSELPTLFNFNEEDIDWLKCHEYACKNLVKEVCKYKLNNPNAFSSEISKIFKLHVCTIIEYLKSGTTLGWCNYNANDEKLKNYKNNSLRLTIRNTSNLKKIAVYKDSIICNIYDSCNSLVENSEQDFGVKLKKQQIYKACNNSQKQYNGYTFKYVN